MSNKAQTNISDIAALADMAVDTFLRKVKGELGDAIPDVHLWMPDTKIEADLTDRICEWLGVSEEKGKLKTIDSVAITKADEAIEQARFKILELLKIKQQVTIENLEAQSSASGAATGVNLSLLFMKNVGDGFDATNEKFLEKSWEVFDDQMDSIEQTAIDLANSVGKSLGKATVKKQQAQKRIEDLQARVKKLIS